MRRLLKLQMVRNNFSNALYITYTNKHNFQTTMDFTRKIQQRFEHFE